MKKHFAIIAPLISLFGLLTVVFLVWPSMKLPGDAFVYISEVIFVLLGILLFAPFRAILLQCKRDKKRKFAFFYFIFVTLYTAFLLGEHGFFSSHNYYGNYVQILVGVFPMLLPDIMIVIYCVIQLIKNGNQGEER